jgi:ferrochelatase
MDTIARIGSNGATHVLVIPISFVSDHSETLYEINMGVRRHARHHGIRHFDMMPALNTAPPFIESLADLVLREMKR